MEGTTELLERRAVALGPRPSVVSRRQTLVDLWIAVGLAGAGAHLILWRMGHLSAVGPAGWLLFALELTAVGWMFVTALLVSGRSSADIEAPEPAPGTTLAVLIPVAGEPVEMVRATVQAALRIDYPVSIFLCNDGFLAGKENWQSIQALAHELGVYCLTRRAGERGKAGNLNHLLHYCDSDVILVIDADHQVVPNVAQEMLGWFRHDDVAFVCTPQQFRGADRDPLNPDEPVFYRAIQPARDRHGLAFSTGNGVMYRREAIARIGGFSEWSVVEDLHTSMRLHAAGWRSVFHPRPVSIGDAPATAAEYARQRLRWAVDSLRILRHDPPWRHRGLSTRARLHYTHTLLSYPMAMLQLGFLLGPPAWILGRLSVLGPVTWREQLVHFVPWFAAIAVALLWWGGPRGAVRTLRLSAAFLPSVFWIAAAKTFSPAAERGTATNKVRQPKWNSLVFAGSVLPSFLLATLVFSVVDQRAGGSDIAVLWAAVLFSISLGPLLRFGPSLRWPAVLQAGLIGLAAVILAGSTATARFGWEAPGGLYASFRNDPAAADLRVETNEFGENLVVGPAVPGPAAQEELASAPVRLSLAAADGVYVGFTSDALPFDQGDVGRWRAEVTDPQIVHWYQQWGSGESRFRGDWLAEVAADGGIPMVSWEAWAKPSGTFHSAEQELGELRRIIDGEHDEYLDEWAEAAAAHRDPILLRPFHEMNGFWYPWSVGVNGNTAEDFVEAWRHVVGRFDAAGATNVSFVWSINTFASFDEGRGIEAYYPGGDYVDWVGTSGFNWADSAEWASWLSAEEVFGDTYEVLASFGKPVMFAEIGTGQSGGDPDQWVADALDWFTSLPDLGAIVWFDRSYDGTIDFRLTSSQQSLMGSAVADNAAYADGVELIEHPIHDDAEQAAD